MDRRSFLALLAIPAVAAAAGSLQGCSSEGGVTSGSSSGPSTTPPSTPSGAAGVARSAKPRAATSLTDAVAATTVVNDFGVDMYRVLKDPAHTKSPTIDQSAPQNLVFSPASIAIALAMTRTGARGTTATEMDAVLHVGDAAALPHAMNALSSAFDSRTKKAIAGSDSVDVTLNVANSLWGQQGLAFETAFLDVLATEYGAGLQLVDYKADPEGARKLINAWVNDATKQRIPELLPQGVITSEARLTLVNAIYMKAPWLYPFVPSRTTSAAFTTLRGSVVQAPFMQLSEELFYLKGAGWQSVELDYVGNELTMVLVLPDDGASLDSAVAVTAAPQDARPATRQVTLSMPKFDIETMAELSTLLGAMGMPTAFTDSADFSGMTTEEKLLIGAVIHQANITVDEAGTEAAAATAVVMRATSANLNEPVVLTLDRPFVFAIRDNPTGAVLFLGHIGDPTETRH